MINMYSSNMIKANLYNDINIIPVIFLLLNLVLTIYLINENKKINLVIKKIPFEEIKNYQQFANNKKELEILKWKEQNYVDKINKNEKEIIFLKDKVLNLELKLSDKNLIKNNSILFNEENNSNLIISDIDKDMVGLQYPEINYKNIKFDLKQGKLISGLFSFLQQLEIKLLYMEKEINVTRLFSYYNSRISYLNKKKVVYDDSNIVKFHQMLSWLAIHQSTQLQGIASDKYLSCKYTEMKIGENLCSHKIGVYDSIDDIDFENITKIGNIVLKVTNGCNDNIFITEKSPNIDKIKKELQYHFNREFSIINPEFFHLYSKKRIILEKIFQPISDLYEFKFNLINREIKIISILAFINDDRKFFHYNPDFTPLFNEKKKKFFISMFDKDILEKLKNYAIKLSEDFPNHIRVDLYLFQNKIYLSELTFDHMNGLPDKTYDENDLVKLAVKNWKRYY